MNPTQTLQKLKTEYLQTGDEKTLRDVLTSCLHSSHSDEQLPQESVCEAVDSLVKYDIFGHVFDQFADLYIVLERMFKGIPSVQSPQVVYDCALGIGKLLSVPIEPDKYFFQNVGANIENCK